MIDLEPTAPWARLPTALAGAMAPQVERIQAEVLERIDAERAWTARMASPKVRADLAAATQAVVARFVALIGTSEPTFTEADRRRFRDLGAGEAREGRGLEDLLAAYRVGTRVLYAEVAEALSGLDSSPAAQVALGEAVFALVDALQAESADGYAHEVTTHTGERERRLRRLADALFDGETEVARSLAALVGWTVPSALAVALLPVDALAEARALVAGQGFVVERDGAAVAVITAGRGLERLVRQLAALPGPAGSVRVGPTVPPGQARRSLLLAGLTAEAPGVHWAVEELPQLLTRAAPEITQTLGEHLLAPLAELRAAQRERLVATLDSWLRHWGQRLEIAEELAVHPQTVAYRVNQLREVFGDDLDDPTWRLGMQLALLAATGQ